MRVIGQRIKRMATIAVTAILSVSLASCGQATDDNRTEISVWSWEPSMGEVIRRFEKANPDIRVKWTNISGYGNLNTAIQDCYGTPDVAQIEYYALLQYAVSGQLLDLTDKIGSDYSNFFTLGTWSSVQLAGRTYGLPMDSGPMGFFYNEDVFRQAGVDATKIKTWDDYYEAAEKLKEIGAYDKTIVQLLAAALVMVPYCALTGERFTAETFQPVSLACLLVLGMFHTGFAYALYFGSMKALRAQTIAIFSYIDPVIAILLSVTVLHDPFSILSAVGSVLILGAAFVSEKT